VFNGPSYGFLDGIPLKRVEGAMDLFSMGNYLKTLGLFRALTISAIGIRVLNARSIHDLEGGHVFGEVMIDVATCISDCLKPSHRMIAYAGGGIFVCLMPRAEIGEPEVLADRLREYILEFEEVYGELGIQLPTISVGVPVTVRAAQINCAHQDHRRGHCGGEGARRLRRDDGLRWPRVDPMQSDRLQQGLQALRDGFPRAVTARCLAIEAYPRGRSCRVRSRNYVAEADREAIQQHAHKTAGVAATFGFSVLGEKALAVEQLMSRADGTAAMVRRTPRDRGAAGRDGRRAGRVRLEGRTARARRPPADTDLTPRMTTLRADCAGRSGLCLPGGLEKWCR
jgi:GGDEF domain-containing protein